LHEKGRHFGAELWAALGRGGSLKMSEKDSVVTNNVEGDGGGNSWKAVGASASEAKNHEGTGNQLRGEKQTFDKEGR